MDLIGYAVACLKRQHILKLKVLGLRIGVGSLPEMLRLLPVENVLVEIREIPIPVTVRIRTADPWIFKRIFTDREYDYGLPADPRVIIDGGANVGYSVAWYKARFPKAKIIAIEPNHDNFKMLQRNCGELPNVHLVHAAIWSDDTTLTLCHRGSEGEELPPWGTRIKPNEVGAEHVRGISLNTVISEYKLDHIDILKLDIEGAEKEVFEAKNRHFVDLVDCFAIECHDQFKPGCLQAVNNALKNGFRQSSNGKKLFYHRVYPLVPAIKSNQERNIWLVSDGRSGSTWISSLINHRQCFAEYFEPLHEHHTPELAGEPLIRYVRPGELPEIYRYLYGRIFSKKWSSRWSGPKYPERPSVLIKDIHALLLAKALADEVPTLDVVCLVRDPVQVAVSKLRQGARSKWFGEPAQLLADAALRHDWLLPFEEEIRSAETQFQKYVVLWAIMYHVMIRQFGQSISYIRYHDSYALIRESIGSILEHAAAPSIEDREFDLAFSRRSRTDDLKKMERYEPTGVEIGYAQHIVKLFDLQGLLAPTETRTEPKIEVTPAIAELGRHRATLR